MNPGSLSVTMHLLTIRGFVMKPEVMAGLAGVACPEGEYSLHLNETHTGIAAFLRCRKPLQIDARWAEEHDPAVGRYTYCTVFETESAPEIVDAIRRSVEVRELVAHAA